MKFATVVVAFVSFCLVSSYSNPAFAAVIDAGDTPASASAAIVAVTPRDETSDGPRRRPRRTLAGKKNSPAAAAAVAALGVSTTEGTHEGVATEPSPPCPTDLIINGQDCLEMGMLPMPEQACKERECCYWYPHWTPLYLRCQSLPGVSCGNHRAPRCDLCPYYDNVDHGYHYCHGDCKWERKDWHIFADCYPN